MAVWTEVWIQILALHASLPSIALRKTSLVLSLPLYLRDDNMIGVESLKSRDSGSNAGKGKRLSLNISIYTCKNQ